MQPVRSILPAVLQHTVQNSSVRPLLPQHNSQDSKLLLNLFFAQGTTPSCHSPASSSFFSYLKVQLCATCEEHSPGRPAAHCAEHQYSPSAPTAKEPGQETAAKPLLCTRIYTILPLSCFFFLLCLPKSATVCNLSGAFSRPSCSTLSRKPLFALCSQI